MAWIRRHLIAFAALAVLVYMLVPNIVVAVFSFNEPKGKFNYSFNEFSTAAWTNPCGAQGICESLGLSLQIGRHRVDHGGGPRLDDRLRPRSLPVPGPLGDQPAHLHADGHARGRHGLEPADALPRPGRALRPGAILIAHIMFCVSFVVVAVKARVATLDPKLEEAAADLGANPTQTFLRVTLPLAAPGIAAGALLAFSLSFDDYIITNFNASPSSITFPMFVWGATARGVPVQVYVIGTVMFLLALLFVVTGQVIGKRRNRQVA